MIVAPILLLCLPSDFFDQPTFRISVFEWLGSDGHYSRGLTRACMHLLHFDFKGAAEFNKLSFVVVPLLMVLWASGFYFEVKRYYRLYLNQPQKS